MKWYVYGLVDPRSSAVFYVGCTTNPDARIKKHQYDAMSSAYERIREIIAAGHKPHYIIFSAHRTRHMALHNEWRFIKNIDGLTNNKPFYSYGLSKVRYERKLKRRVAEIMERWKQDVLETRP